MKLYLDVPYSEKDEAKALGAKWNPKVKKWYINVPYEEYLRFSKWILKDTDDAIIATEYLYIIEGKRICWSCGNPTTVIGLGIGEHTYIYKEEKIPKCELCMNDEIHLAWLPEEDKIPPKLLRYLKQNYSLSECYSNTVNDTYFANCCTHCGALQGEHFLFDEPSSVLSSCANGYELVDRMSKLVIKGIPIEDDLQINWQIGFCSNDYAYLKYGKFEELILSSEYNNDYISYEELYDIR